MPTFLILANRAEYHFFFHRLCIYQDRATEHLRPNSRKKKCEVESGVIHLTCPSTTLVYDSDLPNDAVTLRPR